MCNTDSTAHHLFFLVSFLGQGLQGHKCKPKKKKFLLGLPMAAGGGGGGVPPTFVGMGSVPPGLPEPVLHALGWVWGPPVGDSASCKAPA